MRLHFISCPALKRRAVKGMSLLDKMHCSKQGRTILLYLQVLEGPSLYSQAFQCLGLRVSVGEKNVQNGRSYNIPFNNPPSFNLNRCHIRAGKIIRDPCCPGVETPGCKGNVPSGQNALFTKGCSKRHGLYFFLSRSWRDLPSTARHFNAWD